MSRAASQFELDRLARIARNNAQLAKFEVPKLPGKAVVRRTIKNCVQPSLKHSMVTRQLDAGTRGTPVVNLHGLSSDSEGGQAGDGGDASDFGDEAAPDTLDSDSERDEPNSHSTRPPPSMAAPPAASEEEKWGVLLRSKRFPEPSIDDIASKLTAAGYLAEKMHERTCACAPSRRLAWSA